MKFSVALLVAALACAQATSNGDLIQKWQQFQAAYEKSYRSPVEASQRFTIFKSNVEKMELHNAKFQQGEASYSMAINQFADWTGDEFMAYVNKGLIKPMIKGELLNKTKNFVAAGSVDWRKENAVTGVKDQGQCGGCWAFSTTGSIEGQLGIKGKLTSLSEQNLIDCSSAQGNMGCGGGLMTSAFDYVKIYGIESEAAYPFEEQNDECRYNSTEVVTKISSYIVIPQEDEESLQQAIATRGPVSVGIAASNALQMYSSGILDDDECDYMSLNHGVLAVGYGSENGRPYYIIKNSWGASWGEEGYFKLPRNDNNKCGVASMASIPEL